jgi:hypothetical protein
MRFLLRRCVWIGTVGLLPYEVTPSVNYLVMRRFRVLNRLLRIEISVGGPFPFGGEGPRRRRPRGG